MNGMDRFERWARSARREEPPRPDVVRAVMGRLERPAAAPAPRRLLWAMCGAAACAALACAALGLQAWAEMQDPLRAWLTGLADWGTL